MINNYVTKSSLETQQLAANLIKNLKNNRIITLTGNLGSGKTTFIQGLGKALGINKKIISPTFLIMRSYQVPEVKNSINFIYHLDLYRIKNNTEIIDLGLYELMKDKNNLFAIEWPEVLNQNLPGNKIEINLKYIDENSRNITIDYK